MSPEILDMIPHKGAPGDIFAMSVVLFTMANGFPPFLS